MRANVGLWKDYGKIKMENPLPRVSPSYATLCVMVWGRWRKRGIMNPKYPDKLILES